MGVMTKYITPDGKHHIVSTSLYGTCATAAGTAAKIVLLSDSNIDSVPLVTGMTLKVKFTNANTVASPTLTIQNSAGSSTLVAAKNIYRYGTTAPSTSATTSWQNNQVVTFTYDGTSWMLNDWTANDTNSDTLPAVYVGTAAATVAKVGSSTNFALHNHCYVYVSFRYTNSAASPTLNINSTGAKPIYVNGAVAGTVSLPSNQLTAGSYLGYYDGTNYYFRTDGALTVGENNLVGYTCYLGVEDVIDPTHCTALGYQTSAYGYNNYAEGYQTVAYTGNYDGWNDPGSNHAEGRETEAGGQGSHSEGSNTTAIGVGSHSEGYLTLAKGGGPAEADANKYTGCHAEGYATYSFGFASHAEGNSTSALIKGRSGTYSGSHAEGHHTYAYGIGAHAEGCYTYVTSDYSHAEGQNTSSTGTATHAEGVETKASSQSGAHAEGYGTLANQNAGHAEGIRCSAVNSLLGSDASHAEGYETISMGTGSHSEGYGTSATGDYTHTEGYGTSALMQTAHAEGYKTTAKGGEGSTAGEYSGSHAEGYKTYASGFASHTEGNICTSAGGGSHTEGYMSYAGESCCHSEGNRTSTYANSAHSEGYGTCATGLGSHAEGGYSTEGAAVNQRGTYALGENSHAEGLITTAEGATSHAEGNATSAVGANSHAEGSNSRATGTNSHAEGNNTRATGNYSHSEGDRTTASGESSHAEGRQCKATTTYAHSEGYQSLASGSYSHAEGYCTTASGNSAHSEGYGTSASSKYSHAEGYKTYALVDAAHTSGAYTSAANIGVVSGHFNKPMSGGGSISNTTGTAHLIGNGTSLSNGTVTQSNAFSVQYDGTTKIAGTFTANTAADYAEMFEWYDENPDDEDRVGYFITFEDGNKIRIVNNENDYILGISSGDPFVLGNGDCDYWTKLELRDDFNRVIYEPAQKMIIDEETGEFIPVYDEDGNPVYEGTRPKYNPDYDPSRPYISRLDRKEWQAVGMLGVLRVRQDGTLVKNGYCTIDYSTGKATFIDHYNKNDYIYRVIQIINEEVAEVVFK